MIATGFCGAVIGLDAVLGSRLALLTLATVPVDAATIALCVFVLHESPKYLLITRRDMTAAAAAITFYHGRLADHAPVVESYKAEEAAQSDADAPITFVNVMRTRCLRRAVLLGAAGFVVQVASGTFALHTSTAIAGIYFVGSYSTIVFARAGLSKLPAQMCSLAMIAVSAVSTAVAAAIIERYGRRRLLLGANCAMHVCLVGFGVTLVLADRLGEAAQMPLLFTGLAVIIVYSAAFSFGPGPIPWFIAAECCAQQHRAYVQGVCQMVNITFVCLFTLVSMPLYDHFGAYMIPVVFTLPSAGASLFLYRRLPETKGADTADIVRQLMVK